MTVTLNSVTTADAAPTTVPHRISNKTGKSTATVVFTVTGATIHAWRVTVGGNRKTGRLAGRAGLVCGIDRAGPTSRSLSRPSGTQFTEPVTFVEASDGGADGTRVVDVNAWSDAGLL